MSRHEYSPQIRSAMNQLSWHGRLNDAVSQEDVVAVARDYVALWAPEELGQMPHGTALGQRQYTICLRAQTQPL